MEEFVAEMPAFDADGLAGQLQQMQGSVAVFTQSNAQALTVVRDLYLHGIQADLLARSADRSIDPSVPVSWATRRHRSPKSNSRRLPPRTRLSIGKRRGLCSGESRRRTRNT